jgi:hypothetical protein
MPARSAANGVSRWDRRAQATRPTPRQLWRPRYSECLLSRQAERLPEAAGSGRAVATRSRRAISPERRSPERAANVGARPSEDDRALCEEEGSAATEPASHALQKPTLGAVSGTARGPTDPAVGAGAVVLVRVARVPADARLHDRVLRRRNRRGGRRSVRSRLRCTPGRLVALGRNRRAEIRDRGHPGGRSQYGRAGRVPTVAPSTTGRTVRCRITHEGSHPSSVGDPEELSPQSMRWNHSPGQHQL